VNLFKKIVMSSLQRG